LVQLPGYIYTHVTGALVRSFSTEASKSKAARSSSCSCKKNKWMHKERSMCGLARSSKKKKRSTEKGVGKGQVR
jgi:hypothetical protein